MTTEESNDSPGSTDSSDVDDQAEPVNDGVALPTGASDAASNSDLDDPSDIPGSLSELDELAVSAALRELAPQGSIPADVATQIFAALAKEFPLVPVAQASTAGEAETTHPTALPAHDGATVHQITQRREPRWRRPLFAVAGIAAASLIAVTVGPSLLQSSSSNDSDAGATAEAASDETASDGEGSPGYTADDSASSPGTATSDALSALQAATRLLAATEAGAEGEIRDAVAADCGQVLAEEVGQQLIGATVLDASDPTTGERVTGFVIVTISDTVTFYSVVPTCNSGRAEVTESGRVTPPE